MGMTYRQFWFGDPTMVKAYRKADQIRRRRKNEELWLSGMYTVDALAATVGNMLTKSKFSYPTEPKPITRDEIQERKERERKQREEKMKAKFTAKALMINAQKGAK